MSWQRGYRELGPNGPGGGRDQKADAARRDSYKGMVSAAPDSQTVPGRPSGIPIYEHRDLSVLGGEEGFFIF